MLLGVVAGAEALKARRESMSESESDILVNLGGNASLGDTLIAGGNINQNRTTANIDQSRTNNFRGIGGAAAVLAILTLGSAAGGTIYISQSLGKLADRWQFVTRRECPCGDLVAQDSGNLQRGRK